VPAPPAHLRPHLAAGLAAFLVLFGLYMFWFRDSSFVRVDHVTVSGLSEAPRLRAQLAETAMTMTTLHVDHDRLENVLAGYPAVERIEVDADLPHALRIDVIERQAAVIVVSGRSRMPVAGDGRLLRGLKPQESVPVIRLQGALPSERLGPGTALDAAAIAGAAPPELRRRLSTVVQAKDRGLVAKMRRGPDLVFGDTTRLQAKWLAAASVLADRKSRGATYVDLRLPDRPAAGGLPVEETAQEPQPAPVQQAPAPAQQAPPPAQQAPPAAAPTNPQAQVQTTP
jgi:cell division protein FtsQ